MNRSIISIGPNCRVCEGLDRLELRKESFPFDWALLSVKSIYQIILNDFDGLCADMTQDGDVFYCIKYDICFPHFLKQENFQDKLHKRVIRMKKSLENGCFLIRGFFSVTDTTLETQYQLRHSLKEDIEYLKKLNELLMGKFPNSSIIVIHSQDIDIPYENEIQYYKQPSGDISPVCEYQRQSIQTGIKSLLIN